MYLIEAASAYAASEDVWLGHANMFVSLSDVGRIDDPLPTFRPHLGDLQCAVNDQSDEVLFAWLQPNGYSPPRYILSGELLSAEGESLSNTRFYDGVLPGHDVSSISELSPRLSYNDASSQYLIASQTRGYYSETEIGPAGRHLSSANEQISAPFRIDGVAFVIHLTYNALDSTFLALGYEREGQRRGIYSSILDASGATLTASARLDGIADDPPVLSPGDVALSTISNKYLAIWKRDEPQRSLEAQLLDHNGNAIGNPLPLAATPDPQFQSYYRVEMAYNGKADQFLVAYDAYQQVRGQLINAAGDLIGGELVLSTTPPVRPGGLVDFALAFDDELNQYALTTIRDQKYLDLRVFDRDGRLVGHPVTVATAKENMFEVELASFGQGRFYAAWTTASLYGSSTEIHGRSLRIVPEPSSATAALISTAVVFLYRVNGPWSRRCG